MQRKGLPSLAIALTLGGASTVFAQEPGLSGVTMRVLDDVKGVDAVVLTIGDERDDDEARDGDDKGNEGDDVENGERAEQSEAELENDDVLEDPEDEDEGTETPPQEHG